eukprot:3365123-Rhodomonas_salina.1
MSLMRGCRKLRRTSLTWMVLPPCLRWCSEGSASRTSSAVLGLLVVWERGGSSPDFAFVLARVTVDEHEEGPPAQISAVPVLVERGIDVHVLRACAFVRPNNDLQSTTSLNTALLCLTQAGDEAYDFAKLT